MTQFYASWALILLGWLAWTTRMFIRDNTKAIAVERAAGLGRGPAETSSFDERDQDLFRLFEVLPVALRASR